MQWTVTPERRAGDHAPRVGMVPSRAVQVVAVPRGGTYARVILTVV
jgi:hypothetical protein